MEIEKAELYTKLDMFFDEVTDNTYYMIMFDRYSSVDNTNFTAHLACSKDPIQIRKYKYEKYIQISSMLNNLMEFSLCYDKIEVRKHYINSFSKRKAKELYEKFKDDKKVEIEKYNCPYFYLSDKYNEFFLVKSSCVRQYLNYFNECYQKENNNEPSV